MIRAREASKSTEASPGVGTGRLEEGGYVVTSPLDPQLIAEAETVAEAFENARDALAALAASRRKLFRKLAGVKA
jgi:predicted RNase H-like HicB family nuclease